MYVCCLSVLQILQIPGSASAEETEDESSEDDEAESYAAAEQAVVSEFSDSDEEPLTVVQPTAAAQAGINNNPASLRLG